jgi:hypothetical protein
MNARRHLLRRAAGLAAMLGLGGGARGAAPMPARALPYGNHVLTDAMGLHA